MPIFEETKLANIHVGDPVEATLLGFQAPINGRIESITGGIICRIARESTQRYLSPQLDALEQQPILNSAVGSRGVPSTGAIKTSSFASGSLARRR
jgi:hypothetical protein